MKTSPSLYLALSFAAGCGTDGPADLRFYPHPCGRGDPVERSCSTGDTTIELTVPGVPGCAASSIMADTPCVVEGQRCVLLPPQACASNPSVAINSAAFLTCRAEPLDESTPCPMSSARFKRDIHRLTAAERRHLAERMLDVQLATYRYRPEAEGPPGPQLGFILEEVPDGAPDLRWGRSGERVNLYAYTSAILALVQEQQRQIDELSRALHGVRGPSPICGERGPERALRP